MGTLYSYKLVISTWLMIQALAAFFPECLFKDVCRAHSFGRQRLYLLLSTGQASFLILWFGCGLFSQEFMCWRLSPQCDDITAVSILPCQVSHVLPLFILKTTKVLKSFLTSAYRNHIFPFILTQYTSPSACKREVI